MVQSTTTGNVLQSFNHVKFRCGAIRYSVREIMPRVGIIRQDNGGCPRNRLLGNTVTRQTILYDIPAHLFLRNVLEGLSSV